MDRKTHYIFSQRICKLRSSKRLSQEKTADYLNVSRGYYGAIERGDQYPRLDMLFHLSKLFEMPIHELPYFESPHQQEQNTIQENTLSFSSFEQ